jgi:hypothetical protein
MNTKTIGGIFLGLIVIGGGVWIFSTQKALAPSESMSSDKGTQKTDNLPLSGSGMFADLLARGGSYQCTVSIHDPQASSNGTVYIADKNIRGDFVSEAAGQKIASSMIQTKGYIYTWTNLYSQGFKVPMPTAGDQPKSTEQGGFDTSANISYDCKPWSVDTSKFIVPTNITFSSALER